MKKLKNLMITSLFVISLTITALALNVVEVKAEQSAGDKITCYSVLETCMQCRYQAVECSTCTSKKCDNYSSSGKCTASTTAPGGGSSN